MKKRFDPWEVRFLLGANDPEMAEIRHLLARTPHNKGVWTLHRGGRPALPRLAYQAEPCPCEGRDISLIVLVECDEGVTGAEVLRVDHHRPGDPGYGRPPAEFLPASSLGQVISLLASWGALAPHTAHPAQLTGWRRVRSLRRKTPGGGGFLPGDHEPGHLVYDGMAWWVRVPEDPDTMWARVPIRHVLAAAADHCLHAAYRGECPGVSPRRLMRWRVETRARHQGRPVSHVLRDVEAAREALRRERDRQGPVPHMDPLPELPEAAAREGIAFTARLQDRGGDKLVLQGADPDTIRAWMEDQRSQGREVYGDPARGFAGARL